ncbi:MAG TPA: CBS domain-containing protein [Gemmatimonadales bacterium]|nr:CBS domain-containing protein [Gemmatimonadales bacterium]
MITPAVIRQIHEVMTLEPFTVTEDTGLEELMDLFSRRDFNAFPVVDHSGTLQGIVTKLDLLRALRPARGHFAPDLKAFGAGTVQDVMRRGVIAVEPGDPVSVAADLMIETRLRSLPVVERKHGEGPHLVGIVSHGDVLRGLRFDLADAQPHALTGAPRPRPA